MPPHADMANAMRMLAVDAVEKAKSGHPGMPMGMADIATVLWNRLLRHDPADPHGPTATASCCPQRPWLDAALRAAAPDRLRAVPSTNCKHFRQLASQTPGHPEMGITPGVETTTGPLGQGLANAVGMALAERLLATSSTASAHESSITAPSCSSATAA